MAETSRNPALSLAGLSLAEVHQRVLACYDCDLSQSRSRAVPGEGAETAEVFFVGEAPGFHEDQLGRPFVGPAGQLLEELLGLVGLRRAQVFITNVVKCRPPNNREPMAWEVEACQKYLHRQVELIRPRLAVTLGRVSLAKFFPKESITRLHGTWRWKDGLLFFILYHPAAALHQGGLRRTIEEDMRRLPAALAEARKGARNEEKPQQLSFF